MVLTDGNVILRDFCESDIARRIEWETEKTEWQLWDAPWEYDGLSDEEKAKELARYTRTMEGWAKKFPTLSEDVKRTGFQICTPEGEYIGWCNSYRLDDDLNYAEEGYRCAVGIDLPETSARGKGYAFRALHLLIDYLYAHGETAIYTQTWSGNVRMIGLAQKLGFEECRRKQGIRKVRGEIYDGLTFELNREKYERNEGNGSPRFS